MLNQDYVNWIIAVIVGFVLLVCLAAWLYSLFVVFVPDDMVVVRIRKGTIDFTIDPTGNDRVHPDPMPAGTYSKRRLGPWRLKAFEPVVVPEETIGIVVAFEGAEPNGPVVYDPEFGDFTDAAAFIKHGGQRGVQTRVLPPGTYRLHPYYFEVIIISDPKVKEPYAMYGKCADMVELLTLVEADWGYTPGNNIVFTVTPPGSCMEMALLDGPDLEGRVKTYYVRRDPKIALSWDVIVPFGSERPDPGARLRRLTQEHMTACEGDVITLAECAVALDERTLPEGISLAHAYMVVQPVDVAVD